MLQKSQEEYGTSSRPSIWKIKTSETTKDDLKHTNHYCRMVGWGLRILNYFSRLFYSRSRKQLRHIGFADAFSFVLFHHDSISYSLDRLKIKIDYSKQCLVPETERFFQIVVKLAYYNSSINWNRIDCKRLYLMCASIIAFNVLVSWNIFWTCCFYDEM